MLKYRQIQRCAFAVQKIKNKKIDVNFFNKVEKNVEKTKMVNKKDVGLIIFLLCYFDRI